MSDYTKWRRLEKEFREFQKRHPHLNAAWSSVDDCWTGFRDLEGEEDRFGALVGLAAVTAGHSGGDGVIDYWLKLLKEHLLGYKSRNITIGRVDRLVRPTGAGPTPPGINWADPMVEHGEIYTIRPLCQASADYCLERARQARSEERTAKASAVIVGPKANHLGQTVSPQLPRKRGRPGISLEVKRHAWKAKQRPGTTNKDVAKILYGTPYPSLSQVKNVPAILRYYKKSLEMKKS